jgi:hypothetical protein
LSDSVEYIGVSVMGKSGASSGHSTDAYNFALQERIYPILHLGLDTWLKEVESSGELPLPNDDWRLNPMAMNAIHGKLLAAEKSESSSFYEFQRSLWSSPYTTRMTRDCLLDAFKYFFKCGVPPATFWQRFCRRGEAPVEALDVITGRYG